MYVFLASGMGVSMISHGHSNKGKQQQSNNQCIATLVCMLSCDDGYKLGPKGQGGCQTCECTKHKNKDETGIKFNLKFIFLRPNLRFSILHIVIRHSPSTQRHVMLLTISISLSLSIDQTLVSYMFFKTCF